MYTSSFERGDLNVLLIEIVNISDCIRNELHWTLPNAMSHIYSTRIKSNLETSNSDVSNSAKLEASM